MQIYRSINKVLNENPILDNQVVTYLGRVTHRVPNVNIRWVSSRLPWRKQSSPYISSRIGSIYLPQDFDKFIETLQERPLKKKGVEDNDRNLAFIMAEAENWIFNDVDSQSKYSDMWKDVPNVSQYSSIASNNIPILVSKLNSLLSYKIDSDSRSFELRFPTGYCPVVWSFLISSNMKSIEASLIFRSLEVSRNLLNDLYLFYVYFGYVFSLYDRSKLFDINISAINLFVQDAHCIDFS